MANSHKGGQETLLEAQNLAQGYDHPAIEPEHLLTALIEQEGGGIPSVLKRIGMDQDLLAQGIEQALTRMSRVTRASVQVGTGQDLVNILQEAENIARVDSIRSSTATRRFDV